MTHLFKRGCVKSQHAIPKRLRLVSSTVLFYAIWLHKFIVKQFREISVLVLKLLAFGYIS